MALLHVHWYEVSRSTRVLGNISTPLVLHYLHLSSLLVLGRFMSKPYLQVDDSGKVQRLRKTCPAPECGPGIFMATHFNRVYW